MSTQSKSEPWYIHAILYFVIAVLTYLLIDVAIIEPNYILKMDKFWRGESRARMENIKQAEILWEKEYGAFTDNLDSLINFIKTDKNVAEVMMGVDTVTGRSTNPFVSLAVGEFVADSLFNAPRTGMRYLLSIDTTTNIDTVINRRGRLIGIDTVVEIGTLWKIECPDGYGHIGDLSSNALKNTASWE